MKKNNYFRKENLFHGKGKDEKELFVKDKNILDTGQI
jgi:hypothetical protein